MMDGAGSAGEDGAQPVPGGLGGLQLDFWDKLVLFILLIFILWDKMLFLTFSTPLLARKCCSWDAECCAFKCCRKIDLWV